MIQIHNNTHELYANCNLTIILSDTFTSLTELTVTHWGNNSCSQIEQSYFCEQVSVTDVCKLNYINRHEDKESKEKQPLKISLQICFMHGTAPPVYKVQITMQSAKSLQRESKDTQSETQRSKYKQLSLHVTSTQHER